MPQRVYPRLLADFFGGDLVNNLMQALRGVTSILDSTIPITPSESTCDEGFRHCNGAYPHELRSAQQLARTIYHNGELIFRNIFQ